MRINQIYFDLDETLIYSTESVAGVDNTFPGIEMVTLILDHEVYDTFIHPRAQEVIDYANAIVGRDNVFILTTATKDYALQVNEKAGFGIKKENIIARGEWEGKRIDVDPETVVLVDNLPPKHNTSKMEFLGIDTSHYIKTRDWYAFPEDEDYMPSTVYKTLDTK